MFIKFTQHKAVASQTYPFFEKFWHLIKFRMNQGKRCLRENLPFWFPNIRRLSTAFTGYLVYLLLPMLPQGEYGYSSYGMCSQMSVVMLVCA